ncbi:hypothetical protein [Pseudomonas sp. UBA7530]|uniref:hypothetical protein n=1 Tax=Pseudomonas sp. UBA7530 TaxID=1947341 RepID=UPI0025EB9765|nr:hypothetical protein [Pseudomonas sp. UBA7530]
MSKAANYRAPATGQFISEKTAKHLDLMFMAEDFKRWALQASAAGRKDEARDMALRHNELKREAQAALRDAEVAYV